MLTKKFVRKFDKKTATILTTIFTLSQTVFSPILAQDTQPMATATVPHKIKGHNPTKSNHKNNKTADNSPAPIFQRRKGKLSADEARVAGEEANKFYRLAQQKENAGKLDEAKALYYKAAITRGDVWGHNDSAVAKIAVKIGQIEIKQKHPDAARHWFKQALKSLSKRFGSGDYELVPVLTMLAKLEADAHNHEASSGYYDHILRLQERKFGEENPQTIQIRISYIEELLADKDAFEAEKVANKGIEIEKRVRGAASQNLPKLQQLLSAAQAARASNGGK